MQIISHRGFWTETLPKNSLEAFDHSFRHQLGTETDFRDGMGRLVISHDPAGDDAIDADKVFGMLASYDRHLPLAINIKADGLQSWLKESLSRYGIDRYFLFDMSIPDAVVSLRQGLRIYTRQSDVEPYPNLYDQAVGVWMDSFYDDQWLTPDAIRRHLDVGKEVCLVSPELHHRAHQPFWERLRESDVCKHPLLTLCSDVPLEAKAFFEL